MLSLIGIGPVVLEKKIFYFFQCIFAISLLPWKRAGSFICSNFNPLHPRMLYAKFGWNGFSGSREVDENVKNYDNDNALDDRERTTDKYWSEKFIWDFGSGELKSDEPLYRSEPSLYITYYCSICQFFINILKKIVKHMHNFTSFIL